MATFIGYKLINNWIFIPMAFFCEFSMVEYFFERKRGERKEYDEEGRKIDMREENIYIKGGRVWKFWKDYQTMFRYLIWHVAHKSNRKLCNARFIITRVQIIIKNCNFIVWDLSILHVGKCVKLGNYYSYVIYNNRSAMQVEITCTGKINLHN